MLAIVNDAIRDNVYREDAAFVICEQKRKDGGLICVGVHLECVVARPDHHVLDCRVANVCVLDVHTHGEISHVVGGDRRVGDEDGAICVGAVLLGRYECEVSQRKALEPVQSYNRC